MTGTATLSAADRAQRAGVLIAAVLDERSHRTPEFAAESNAMHWLAQSLNSSDNLVLKTLAEIGPELCGAGSAGISLLKQGGDKMPGLHWVALSGSWVARVGTDIPVEDSPEGVTQPSCSRFPSGTLLAWKAIFPRLSKNWLCPFRERPVRGARCG